MVDAVFTDRSGRFIETVILRKVMGSDIGTSIFPNDCKVTTVYVVLRNRRVVTAFPANEERTHNGLIREKEVFGEELHEDEYYVKEDEGQNDDGYDKDFS